MERKILPTLALLAGLAACASETEPTQEEKIASSLQALDKETDALMNRFELEVGLALQSGQVFEEIPGHATTVVVNGETFNCVDWDSEVNQLFCETGKVGVLTTNPNLVSVDRENSTTLFAGEHLVPVLQIVNRNNNGSGQVQEAVSVFLNPGNCTVNDGGVFVTEDAEIVQKCSTLRDNLLKRMAAIVKQLAVLKKIWGK